MTHEELIARLRQDDTDFWHCEAADRIEALVKDKRWIVEERDRTFALMLARAERLEAALREIAETFDGKSVAAIARAALKGADHD